MDTRITAEQQALCDNTRSACRAFDDDYWYDVDQNARFPEEFYRAMAENGVLGIAMPEKYGGTGLGVTEAALVMHEVAAAGGGQTAASAIHINIFGPHPIAVFGTEEQRQRFLPPLIEGREKTCFGVTEPDAGLETTRIQTRAERQADGSYRVWGKKIWTTTAQEADKIMLLVRTTPFDEVTKKTHGLSLFYTDLDRNYCDVRRIPKMGRAGVDSNEVFIEGLPVPEADRIGDEGRGFEYILHSLNPERILIAMEAVGLGRNALERAAAYARERSVFGRPIGQNQAIQHPLAESWMELEAASLMAMKAADLYDRGEPCGPWANAAKYLGAEAGWNACVRAVGTHGGMGYAKEYHVERLLREVMIARLAPVSPQLILCNIAEKVLGMPKSY